MNTEELKKLLEEKSQVKVINRGIGPLSLLGIAFVVMKIMGYITWSWWWVLAPFWVPVAIAFALIAIVLFLMIIIVAKTQETVKVNVKVDKTETVPEDKPKRTKKAKKDDGTGVNKKNE